MSSVKKDLIIQKLSTGALFPHTIPNSKKWSSRAGQLTLTRLDITNNLLALHEKVVERVETQFPGDLRINSGFRSGTGGSQHNAGMAVDLQLISPSGDPTKSIEIAKWMQSFCEFDQLAIEYSASNPKRCWIHCSYVLPKYGKNRFKIYTWDAGSKNIVVATDKFLDRTK